jgi:hypothetical protein
LFRTIYKPPKNIFWQFVGLRIHIWDIYGTSMGHPAFRLHFNCFRCGNFQLYFMKGLVPAYRFLFTTETIGWHPSNNVVATIIFSVIYNRLDLNAASPYEGNALLHRIAAGDEQSFRSLFDLYKNRFYLVALKMTRSETVAEELVVASTTLCKQVSG